MARFVEMGVWEQCFSEESKALEFVGRVLESDEKVLLWVHKRIFPVGTGYVVTVFMDSPEKEDNPCPGWRVGAERAAQIAEERARELEVQNHHFAPQRIGEILRDLAGCTREEPSRAE